MTFEIIIFYYIIDAGIAVMTWGANIMTACSYNLLGLYPSSLTSVNLPWRANGISTSTSITAIIMFAVWMHFYNRSFKCLVYKVPDHVCSASQPHKVAWILNGNGTFDLPGYFYSSCTDKLVVKFNRMQCLYRAFFPSHERRCHITCGIQWMPSLSENYSFYL